MSSTPNPRIKKGKTACISENLYPCTKDMPYPAAIDRPTQLSPIIADTTRICTGLQAPSTKKLYPNIKSIAEIKRDTSVPTSLIKPSSQI